MMTTSDAPTPETMGETTRMRLALLRITRRRGPFCRDPEEHAHRVILAGVNMARKALGLSPVDDLEDAERDVPPETDEERDYAYD